MTAHRETPTGQDISSHREAAIAAEMTTHRETTTGQDINAHRETPTGNRATTPGAVSVWRLLSLLLDYPDDELMACKAELRKAASELPSSAARRPILDFLAHRDSLDIAASQREYVETFDFAKRCTLYLSFHTYGDRRQRGMAMLQLKRGFREAGLELAGGALPDHLPAILEFADVMPEAGIEVLCGFRPALEIARAALHKEGSAYAALLDAVCGLLPAASAAALEDARRIAAAGPPTETVGLEPFAPPEVMPVACTADGPEIRPYGGKPAHRQEMEVGLR